MIGDSVYAYFPHTHMSPSMDNTEIQQKCEAFLRSLGRPGFIVFGWQKEPVDETDQSQFGVVSSFHEVPVNAAVKGMTWALSDFVNKSL